MVVSYTVTTARRDQHRTLTITLTGTNDAPVLNAAATPVLSSVAEDAGAPVGAVGTLVSSLVNLNPPAGGLDNVTDADSGAVTGIALTGTDNANGTWYYSTNNGGTWTAVGACRTPRHCCLPPTPTRGSISRPTPTSTAP